MNLQAKIFVPVVSSLIILGGSMYLLNRQILRESYNSEIQKVLSDKENAFNISYDDKLNNLLQYSNILANSYAIRSSFDEYQKTNSLDTTWKIINSEIDQIKYGALLSKQKALNVNAYYKDGKVLFRSRSNKRGDNVLHKRKTIKDAIHGKKVVKGIEVGKYGIDIRAVTPVILNNEFTGCLEVNYPLTDLLKSIQTEAYESYAIIIEKEFVNKISFSDALKDPKNNINENIIVGKTGDFDIESFKLIYDNYANKKISDYGEFYNHLIIPLKGVGGQEVAVLVYQMSKREFIDNMNASSYSLFLIGIMIFLVSVLVLFIVLNKVVINRIKRVTQSLRKFSTGIIAKPINVQGNDEVSEMQDVLNIVNDGMRKMSDFAIEIGDEVYNSNFESLGEKDELGNTLIRVRDKLKNVSEQEKLINKQEKQRSWVIEGHAKFAKLLQEDDADINEYTYSIISNLISYLNLNQAAIFLLKEDKETLYLTASYAYDRRKYLEKEIKIGEGLVGNTAIEGKATYLTDIPNDYVNITSGLGSSNPTSLLIVPMIDNGELIGVIELASFRIIEKFELDFCNKIAEDIAQSISRQQINQQTKVLLEQSRQQSEELSAQEEEMRQNLEEMQATQEEMARKEAELTGLFNALDSSTLLVEFDLDANVISANDKILETFGLESKKQIIGRNHKDFYDSEGYEERARQLWVAIRNKETVSRKAKVVLPSGQEVWLNETYSPILDRDQNIERVLNISFDITEEVVSEIQVSQQNEEMQAQEEEMRQNMEEMQATHEEMERKEIKMHSVLDALKASVLVVEFDLQGNVIDVNDKILKTFGIKSKEQIIGANHKDFYNSDNYELEAQQLWKQISQKETVSRKAQVKFPNGKTVWLNETYSPILDYEQNIERVLNISFDITEVMSRGKM